VTARSALMRPSGSRTKATNARFDAITLTGGQVLGLRPLALGGLVPNPLDGVGTRVWGALTIHDLAEQYFTP
jgi:hypothetical protein